MEIRVNVSPSRIAEWNLAGKFIYREYVYSAVVYQKYLTRLREMIIFEPLRNFLAKARKLSFVSTELDIFDIPQH